MTTHYLTNKKTNPFSNKNAFILSIRLSIPFNAIMLLGIFYSTNIALRLMIAPIMYMILSNILLFYILLVFNFNIIQRKWTPKNQFIVLILGNIAISVVLSLIFSNLLFLFASDSLLVKKGYIVINIIKDLVVVMMAQITTLLAYSSKKELESAIVHERLITENIRTRYEVLKGQVDPHFIFNSLNTLDGLIGVNDEGAHGYLQNFSSVFRYVLNNKEITHLSDELTFTESYATLMKIRYGDNFRMEYHIDEKYKAWFIMPISLQLLVENAIKHNVISKNSPLLVNIETTSNDTIRVKNVINLKKEPEQGEGIGLANLTDRYNLLFHKEVLITQTDVFSVEIPLIKQLDKSKINYK
jgi:sensor histidine kinase YesM